MNRQKVFDHVIAMYFSPCGTTERTVKFLAENVAEKLDCDCRCIDFTLPEARKAEYRFSNRELVVFGTPVYAGRVPNVLVKFLRTIQGGGAGAVTLAVYGNRSYGDAAAELRGLLQEDGFRNIAAGAFIGEHCMSEVLAKGRPDKADLGLLASFADSISEKIKITPEDEWNEFAVSGEYPPHGYYQAQDRQGNPIDIKKVRPVTGETCDNCGICICNCPMGAISSEDPRNYTGTCIKCGRCLKICPRQARYYDSEMWLYHIREVEEGNKERKAPVIFV